MDGAARSRRPTQAAPAAGGDWRTQLQHEKRSRIVNMIMETLKNHLPVSVPEGLGELHEIAMRFEEKIYTAAINQSYLGGVVPKYRGPMVGLLERVRAAIKAEEQKKTEVPELIDKVAEEIKLKGQQLQALYKDIKIVPSTADEDNQTIKEVDEICLRAMKVIQDALGL